MTNAKQELSMKISIGSDHRGYNLKESLKKRFNKIEWTDAGTNSPEKSSDFPVFASLVCQNVLKKTSELGLLICGSGIGMSIAANRNRRINAALCWNEEIAKQAREHNAANVLVLPADFVDSDLAAKITESWLKSEFKAGKYEKRLQMIDPD